MLLVPAAHRTKERSLSALAYAEKIIEDEELLSRHHIPANFLRLRVLNEVPFQVPTAFTYKLQRPKCLILKILANFLKLECTVCKKKTELLHLKKGD